MIFFPLFFSVLFFFFFPFLFNLQIPTMWSLLYFYIFRPFSSPAHCRNWAVSKSQRVLACIITFSRWHIYCYCQQGRASVLVNVVEYEKGNYISLGDLLTAMTTSYLYIIIIGDDFQVLQSPTASFNSHHI